MYNTWEACIWMLSEFSIIQLNNKVHLLLLCDIFNYEVYFNFEFVLLLELL